MIKGIAILMMLFFHLFFREEVNDLCSPLIMIGDTSLVYYFSQACYPVSFFMILSGYGLTFLFKNNKWDVKGQGRRLLKLYTHYWIILLIFVSIGHFINSQIYPNDLLHVIVNVIGIRCTYNGETWFLLSYALISLSSYWIIKYVYYLNNKKQTAATLVVYAIIFLSARHLGYNLPKNPVWETLLIQPVYFVQLTFYFSLGIVLYRLMEKGLMFGGHKPYIYVSLLVCLFFVKSLFKITIADGLYALLFIILLLNISFPLWINKILYELGRRSMVMWMTHTFFCYYLFPDFIYGFKYPLVIFAVLVIVSYLTAIPIMWIGKNVIRIIRL